MLHEGASNGICNSNSVILYVFKYRAFCGKNGDEALEFVHQDPSGFLFILTKKHPC